MDEIRRSLREQRQAGKVARQAKKKEAKLDRLRQYREIASSAVPAVGPYTAVGIFTFQDAESKKTFIDALTPLVEFVKESEPDTTIYAFYDDKDDPLKMTGFEQWTTEQAFEEHCQTEQFEKFGSIFTPMVESGKVKVEQSFGNADCAVGFLSKT